MAKVAVFVIHGIGDQKSDFADDFMNVIKDRAKSKHSEYIMHSCHWADELQESQDLMLPYIKSSSYSWQFITRWLKSIVVNNISDATSYHQAYDRIHQRVNKELEEVRQRAGNDCKIIVVAHSLGAMIMSDYIYDCQHSADKDPPPERFVKNHPIRNDVTNMKTLHEIVTFGANIPLFRMGFSTKTILSINDNDGKIKWDNFYSPFDLLGYHLNEFYTDPADRPKIEDHRLFWNGIFGFCFSSHSKYWKNRKVINHIAAKIDEIALD
jgi:hypothetical protein